MVETLAASMQLKTLEAAMKKLMYSMSLHLGGFMSITPHVFGEPLKYNYILNDIKFSAFQVRKSNFYRFCSSGGFSRVFPSIS